MRPCDSSMWVAREEQREGDDQDEIGVHIGSTRAAVAPRPEGSGASIGKAITPAMSREPIFSMNEAVDAEGHAGAVGRARRRVPRAAARPPAPRAGRGDGARRGQASKRPRCSAGSASSWKPFASSRPSQKTSKRSATGGWPCRTRASAACEPGSRTGKVGPPGAEDAARRCGSGSGSAGRSRSSSSTPPRRVPRPATAGAHRRSQRAVDAAVPLEGLGVAERSAAGVPRTARSSSSTSSISRWCPTPGGTTPSIVNSGLCDARAPPSRKTLQIW